MFSIFMKTDYPIYYYILLINLKYFNVQGEIPPPAKAGSPLKGG